MSLAQNVNSAMNLAYSFGTSSYGNFVNNSGESPALDENQKQQILNRTGYYPSWEAIPDDIRRQFETAFLNGYQSKQREIHEEK